MNRRNFLKTTAAVGAGYWLTANAASATRAADGPNGKVHFGCVGVGGKGSSDTDHVGGLGEIVALCDIDANFLSAKAKKFTHAEKFADFRKMLDKLGKQIDAITVSSPDHTHAHPSVMAMRMGKHVYCQKPLVHSVYEARLMREEAKKNKVCTQMGNQGTALPGLRRAVELVQAGALGSIQEVHVWTNRPIWPQAPKIMARPKDEQPVPSHVSWDLWIGPAPMRPYHTGYHPFAWRGWWDFGTGAMGDMACHTANMAFMALKLVAPNKVKAEAGDVNPETCPTWAHATLCFPARGDMAPVTFNWYEGKRDGKKVLPPEELLSKLLKPNEKLADSGSILVGSRGVLFSPNDYGAEYRIVGDVDTKSADERLPRYKGSNDENQKKEWVKAIKEGKPEIALSNFSYAGALTESILLGNVAMRAGCEFEYDVATGTAVDCPKAQQYIRREYRKGWEL
jgi:predicted dehydrogenase